MSDEVKRAIEPYKTGEFFDADGNPCSLGTLCAKEPQWAASRQRVLVALLEATEAKRLEAETKYQKCWDSLYEETEDVSQLTIERDAATAECAGLREALLVAHSEGLALMTNNTDAWCLPTEVQGRADRWSHGICSALNSTTTGSDQLAEREGLRVVVRDRDEMIDGLCDQLKRAERAVEAARRGVVAFLAGDEAAVIVHPGTDEDNVRLDVPAHNWDALHAAYDTLADYDTDQPGDERGEK